MINNSPQENFNSGRMEFNLLLTLVGIFLLISLTSAIDLYSGENITLDLSEQYSYYSIVGNSTPINLLITQEGLQVNIQLDKYSQEDNFEIIFFNKEKETITVYQSSGGGGSSRTIYKTNNTIEYVDKTVVEYKDKIIEKEVPIENKIELIKEKMPLWGWIILGLVLLICLFLLYKLIYTESESESLNLSDLENTELKGGNNNEQENFSV